MQETEEENGEEPEEKLEDADPPQAPEEQVNKEPEENLIREIYDLTKTDDEETAAPDDWKRRMEEKVEALVLESAEQNALLKIQKGQITKMVDLVDKVISQVKGETQASHQPLPASLIASQNKTPLEDQSPDLAGPSRKRKSTSQPPSAAPAQSIAKKTRLGSQKRD